MRDEILLVALLGGALSLFLASPRIHDSYALPQLRLFLDTAILLVSVVVAVLALVRFSVEGRRFDLFLGSGFAVTAAAAFAFSILPVLGGHPLQPAEAWAGVAGRLIAGALIAVAPFAGGRTASRRQGLASAIVLAAALALVWELCRSIGSSLPHPGTGAEEQPYLLTGALALQALLSLLTVVGFGLRYRAHGEDLDRFLALGATLGLFGELHAVFTPLLSSDYVSQGDFLRLFSYGVLLVGVWRAIRFAEFGRAVAEERARVAREIHDGLAQYLFAISAQTALLEGGAELELVLPRLREASRAAQQEARFAVLALSSASGNAPFDAALNRYIEFLTVDGALEVDLEIESDVDLGPDEQIEIFRIVQEGLANVHRHAGARSASVRIGRRDGQRVVEISDDGRGFDGEADRTGQGLKNIRTRAASIGGGFRLETRPGGGTALEVVLRT